MLLAPVWLARPLVVFSALALCPTFIAAAGPARHLPSASTTADGKAKPPSASQSHVVLPADAAFSAKFGVFASGPPCDPKLAAQNNPGLLWPGCAGPTTLPVPGTRAYGNPMARPGLGIPLGGIGTGSFMLNQAGTFGPWDMGSSADTNYEDRILPQAAFHLRVQSGDARPTTRTLAINNSQFGSVLPAWTTLPAGQGTYSALYPFGTIDYGQVAPGADATLSFWSPFTANNDEQLAQPVAYFDLKISNTSSRPTVIAAMLTFPNAPAHVVSRVHGLVPPEVKSVRQGFYSRYDVDPSSGVHGVTLGASSPDNTPDAQNSEWTEAVRAEDGQRVSYTTSWNAEGSGQDVYAAFDRDGNLPNAPLDGSHSAGALAVSVRLAPHTGTTIHYALAWDFPQVGFGLDQATVWMRRYTSFYGAKEDAENNYVAGSYAFRQGFAVADRNLARREASLRDVRAWWQPLAFDRGVPAAVRRDALNQVHHLVWTGSFWESGLVRTSLKGGRIGARMPDTHLFYLRTGGGWAAASEANVQAHGLLAYRDLFLDGEKAWVRAVSEQVMTSNGGAPDKFGSLPGTPYFAAGGIAPAPFPSQPRNAAGARAPAAETPTRPKPAAVLTPAPAPAPAPVAPAGGIPFGKPVGPGSPYFDVTPKYLIRAYGIIRAEHGQSALREFYPAMLRAYMSDIARRIPADKKLPIEPPLFGNTYDIMGISEGAHSVYNCGLYLLSLEIMIAATDEARTAGVVEARSVDVATLRATLQGARAAYEKIFWTGSYYRAASEGRRFNDLFSDTLWAQHHALLLGLPDLAPTDHIVTHLRTAATLLMRNKDASGHVRGMANLMRLDGTLYPFVGLPQASTMDVFENGFDAREVWMGTNYALAATYIQEGKRLGYADLSSVGRMLAEALDYQVYSPSSPGKSAYIFNEPNAYYAGDPAIYRGAGVTRNLAAWDVLRAAVAGRTSP